MFISIDVQNTNILIINVLFISFILSTWEGMMRWGFRGITGEEKWDLENGKTGEGTWEGMRWVRDGEGGLHFNFFQCNKVDISFSFLHK